LFLFLLFVLITCEVTASFGDSNDISFFSSPAYHWLFSTQEERIPQSQHKSLVQHLKTLSLTGQCMYTTSSSSDESSGNVSEDSTDESSCGSTDGEEIHSKIVYKHEGEARVATKTRRRKIGEEARVSTERIKRRVRFVHDDAHAKKTK
jgi:hypothetical protein